MGFGSQPCNFLISTIANMTVVVHYYETLYYRGPLIIRNDLGSLFCDVGSKFFLSRSHKSKPTILGVDLNVLVGSAHALKMIPHLKCVIYKFV